MPDEEQTPAYNLLRAVYTLTHSLTHLVRISRSEFGLYGRSPCVCRCSFVVGAKQHGNSKIQRFEQLFDRASRLRQPVVGPIPLDILENQSTDDHLAEHRQPKSEAEGFGPRH
jgi:hypothetical protein